MTDTISQPSLIDLQGNIRLHGREGATIVFQFLDENDEPRNTAALDVYFEVKSGLRIKLTPGLVDGDMVLTLTRDHVKSLFGPESHDFVFVDESLDPPSVLWSRKIYVSGWVQ